MNQSLTELTGYQAAAAELRRIADAIEHLTLDRDVPYINVSFLPSAWNATPEQRIADVDAVAFAVLGRVGQCETHKDGSQYHLVRETRAGVNIAVQERISPPDDEAEAGR